MPPKIALTGIARDLAQRAESGKTIRVGVIGSGEMGTDLVTQMSLMQGIEMAAIATRRPHTALDAMTIVDPVGVTYAGGDALLDGGLGTNTAGFTPAANVFSINVDLS